MSIFVYVACFFLALHCVEEAIKMEPDTNRFRVYSYILFLGSIVGVAGWVYFNAPSPALIGLLLGITAIIFTDRRRHRKTEPVDTGAAYD